MAIPSKDYQNIRLFSISLTTSALLMNDSFINEIAQVGYVWRCLVGVLWLVTITRHLVIDSSFYS